MNSTQKNRADGADQSQRSKRRGEGARVAQYLKEHPEFFTDYPEVLNGLTIPHACGNAVSLIEYQVAALRNHVHRLQSGSAELIDIARKNEALAQRLHRLTLRLIACDKADDLFSALYGCLAEEFGADAAAVRWFSFSGREGDTDRAEFVGGDRQGRALFEHVLESRRVACGRLKSAEAAYLFGETGTGLASVALVPLGSGGQYSGVLAVASRDDQRFRPGMGTVFLERLGETLSQVQARLSRLVP